MLDFIKSVLPSFPGAAFAAISGALAMVSVQWLKSGVATHEQADKLMFEVLQAARSELFEARSEAAHLRDMLKHINHFDEALIHLGRLIEARSDQEINQARQLAERFLERMRAIKEETTG